MSYPSLKPQPTKLNQVSPSSHKWWGGADTTYIHTIKSRLRHTEHFPLLVLRPFPFVATKSHALFHRIKRFRVCHTTRRAQHILRLLFCQYLLFVIVIVGVFGFACCCEMAEIATKFPPQTYCSSFYLNTLPEVGHLFLFSCSFFFLRWVATLQKCDVTSF